LRVAGIDLSVIIVNWNTRELLLRCLMDLGPAVTGLSHEIWCVDNGSQDGSLEAVRCHFPNIHVIANRENLGYARAVNQALPRVTGRYILLLNTDASPRKDALHHLLVFLEGHPEAAAAGGQLLNLDGSRQNSIANFPSLATELLNKFLLQILFPQRFPGKRKEYPEPIEVESVVGACLMVRAEVVNKVGSLDEGFFFFLEETDWCYRMRRAGYKIYHVPHAKIAHLQGASARGLEAEAKIEYHRARVRFFQKHRGPLPSVVLRAGAFLRVGVDTLTLGLLSVLTGFGHPRLRRKAWVALRVLAWYLRGCPSTDGLPKTGGSPSLSRKGETAPS
jgi:GT2 family glycosyltransferase